MSSIKPNGDIAKVIPTNTADAGKTLQDVMKSGDGVTSALGEMATAYKAQYSDDSYNQFAEHVQYDFSQAGLGSTDSLHAAMMEASAQEELQKMDLSDITPNEPVGQAPQQLSSDTPMSTMAKDLPPVQLSVGDGFPDLTSTADAIMKKAMVQGGSITSQVTQDAAAYAQQYPNDTAQQFVDHLNSILAPAQPITVAGLQTMLFGGASADDSAALSSKTGFAPSGNTTTVYGTDGQPVPTYDIYGNPITGPSSADNSTTYPVLNANDSVSNILDKFPFLGMSAVNSEDLDPTATADENFREALVSGADVVGAIASVATAYAKQYPGDTMSQLLDHLNYIARPKGSAGTQDSWGNSFSLQNVSKILDAINSRKETKSLT